MTNRTRRSGMRTLDVYRELRRRNMMLCYTTRGTEGPAMVTMYYVNNSWRIHYVEPAANIVNEIAVSWDTAFRKMEHVLYLEREGS
jgi:hypothetical protein